MPRINIEKNGRNGTYAGDLKISHAWGCPAHVTIPTILGDFDVQVETEKMTTCYNGDQPDWLVFYWALQAVETVVGHEVVFPGTIGPRGTKIRDNPNRETRHAYIITWNWVSKFIRIEVPRGGKEGRADRQLEVDLEYKRKVEEVAWMALLPSHQQWCSEGCGYRGEPQMIDYDKDSVCPVCGQHLYWDTYRPEPGLYCFMCNAKNPSPKGDGESWLCPECLGQRHAGKDRGTPLGYTPKADRYDPSRGY